MVMNWGTALIPNSPAWLWAVVFIAFNTFVNIRGIQMSRGVDWVIFVIEVLAVIAFIALGCNFIMGGGGAGAFVLDPIYQEGQVDAHFIAAGISLAALSFLGFDGMSTLAEETHEPEKNIGRGILIALCAIIIVFVAQTYIAAIVQPDWANTDPIWASSTLFCWWEARSSTRSCSSSILLLSHRQHHERPDGLLAPAVLHGPRRRYPEGVRQGPPEVPDPLVPPPCSWAWSPCACPSPWATR